MSNLFVALALSRERIMLQVLQEQRPAWWLNYRNERWGRSAYLRRRRGWAPQ